MRYDGVIFDNDGVLIELYRPGKKYERAIRELLNEKGINPDKKAIKSLMPYHKVNEIKKTCNRYNLNSEKFWREHEEKTYQVQKQTILDGYKTLFADVEHIENIGVPKGIVSNNQEDIVEFIAERHSSIDFQTFYGREKSLKGLWRRKPNTYYLKKCIDDMGLENPIYIGDSSKDIEAAHKLGIDSVFVRREHREGYYTTKNPTHEIKSLEELPKIVS